MNIFCSPLNTKMTALEEILRTEVSQKGEPESNSCCVCRLGSPVPNFLSSQSKDVSFAWMKPPHP